MMHFFKFIFLLLLVQNVYTAKAQSPANPVNDANTAYNHFELDKSRMIYNSIVDDPTAKTGDKVTALQKMAQQDWKIYQDYNNAAGRLNKAISLKVNSSSSYAIKADISREAGKFQIAGQEAVKALAQSTNETDKINAQLIFAHIIHDQNIQLITASRPINRLDLLKASAALKNILQKQPGRSSPAELLLGISLLLHDGNGIFSAWKAYYFIRDAKTINHVLAAPYSTFSKLLPQWKQGGLSMKDEKALIVALSQSRFNDYATLAVDHIFAKDSKQLAADKDISLVLAYQQFIEQITAMNNKFYPEVAREEKVMIPPTMQPLMPLAGLYG